MKKVLLTSSLVSFFCISSMAQISTPPKKPFNLGIYFGGNVVKYSPFLASDLSIYNTQFRLLYFYTYSPKIKLGKPTIGLGISQELAKTSIVFYNVKWIASSYLLYENEYNRHAAPAVDVDLKTKVLSGVFATGLKAYFLERWYSILQAGVSISKYSTPGYADEKELLPFFEFGVGINLYRTYLNKTTGSEE
ncbi:MAG: hypothetical protein NZ529_04140 [Cytophagaceae bacterium]|nr:hypothetical protein [Cytophagaceae bacterium]MDW8455963.1 hypothetical protein [Cytophagaceae bacterium]